MSWLPQRPPQTLQLHKQSHALLRPICSGLRTARTPSRATVRRSFGLRPDWTCRVAGLQHETHPPSTASSKNGDVPSWSDGHLMGIFIVIIVVLVILVSAYIEGGQDLLTNVVMIVILAPLWIPAFTFILVAIVLVMLWFAACWPSKTALSKSNEEPTFSTQLHQGWQGYWAEVRVTPKEKTLYLAGSVAGASIAVAMCNKKNWSYEDTVFSGIAGFVCGFLTTRLLQHLHCQAFTIKEERASKMSSPAQNFTETSVQEGQARVQVPSTRFVKVKGEGTEAASHQSKA